jgi:hypothetical protein
MPAGHVKKLDAYCLRFKAKRTSGIANQEAIQSERSAHLPISGPPEELNPGRFGGCRGRRSYRCGFPPAAAASSHLGKAGRLEKTPRKCWLCQLSAGASKSIIFANESIFCAKPLVAGASRVGTVS